MGAGEPITLDVADHVAKITLNRPEQRNAMSVELLDAFAKLLAEVRENSNLRALVITGSGKHFCQGADFTAVPALIGRTGVEGPMGMQRGIRSLYDAFLSVDSVSIPVIAAINGSAVGGGLGLALLCDIRIIADEAKIGANFAKLGIHPGLGISALLPRAVGYEEAATLLFTGELIRGPEAARIGLARESLPRDGVLPRAMALAAKIAAGAPLAVRQMKRTLRALSGRDLTNALELESFAQALLGQTADAAEGIQSVLARRTPKFEGK